jgi:hypothetical protein
MASKNYGLGGIGSIVEIGKTGPKVKANSGAIEGRNNADDAFAVVRGDHPVGPNDLVTLRYLQTKGDVTVIGQIDGSAPPAAAVAGRVFVCTTTGGTFTVNYLYYDNGATWEEVIPSEGMSMVVTDALSGGAVTFLADHAYLWDADGTSWIDIGPSTSSQSGVIQSRKASLAFGTSSPLNIGSVVPANARALRVIVSVTQVFNGTTPTLDIGDAGDTDRLMPNVEIDLRTVGVYVADVSYLFSGETQIIGTYVAGGGSPSTGAAHILVEWDQA